MSDSIQPWYQQVPNIQSSYSQAILQGRGEAVGVEGSEADKEKLAAAQGLALPGLPTQAQPQATSFSSDAPPLPNVQGPQAGEGTAAKQGMPSWMSDDRPITSLAQAFDVLIEVAAATMEQNGKLKNIFNADQLSALKSSAEAQIAQVAGERESAANKLIGAAVATVATVLVAGAGAYYNFGGAVSKAAGAGAALGGAGMAVTQLVNSATTYLDTCMPGGGQHAADEAKMRKAVEDIFVQMYKSQEDNFNSSYENSRKAVQNVLDMKRAIDDNTNQVALNILQNA